MNRYRRLRSLLPILVLAALTASGTAIGQTTAPPTAEPRAAEPAPYAALADVLENERTREQLIAELRRLSEQTEAGQTQAGQAAEPAAAAAPDAAAGALAERAADKGLSLPRQIANATKAAAESVGALFSQAAIAVQAFLEPAESPGPGLDMAKFGSILLDLALLIVGTVILFLVLRRLAHPLFARAGRWAEGGDGGERGSMMRRFIAITWSALIDLAVIALSVLGGYVIALYVLGVPGGINTRATLFLNAFVLVEVFKAVIRMVFAARYEGLRLFRMPGDVADYWNTWLARLTGFIGYGLLVAVPIVNFNLSPAVGRLVGLLIMLIAYVYALAVILRNRKLLRARLEARATDSSLAVPVRVLARTWHLLAIAYFTLLFVVSQLYPEEALPFVVWATVQTLLAIGGGMLLSRIITRLIGHRITLSDAMRRRVPTLERQLNSYIPAARKVIRAVIVAAVVLLVLDAWHLFDLGAWLVSEAGQAVVGTTADVVIIIVIAALAWIAVSSIIEHRLSPDTGIGEPSARQKTLLSLFRNALAILIVTMTLMIVLSEIGIDIGPLLAGAGVLGLAIGFGAQKMVQDVITGVFIQLENAMNTGDTVTLAGITGTAERLSIRSVGIRDISGTYHLIPFSSVDTVSNYMRDFAYHVGVYGIAYREDIDEAIERLKAAYDELAADEAQKHKLLGPLEVHGVTALAASSVDIRALIRTKPGAQWGVGRAYNRLVKKHFDAAGIEIPYPHLTLYFGQDKDGGAPAAPLRLIQPQAIQDDSRADGHDTSDPAGRGAGNGRNRRPSGDEMES